MKPTKEPTYPAILLFSRNDTGEEYIVIATEGPIEDHAIHGYTCRDAVEIEDYGILPTGIPMHARS